MKAVSALCLTASLIAAASGGRDRHHPVRPASKRSASNPYSDMTQADIDNDQDMAYWRAEMDEELVNSLRKATKIYPDNAKNVVIFIGDGMSIPTINAARIYKAQLEGNNFDTPETTFLTMERLEHMGHAKTYSMNTQVGDSASTASAIYSGVKTKYGTVGFDSHIERGDPSTMQEAYEVDNMFTWAQRAGMDTGVVTTARLTHATPAAAYAHTFDRDFECDTALSDVYNGTMEDIPQQYQDIAWQFVNRSPGNKLKVAMGGGYPAFFPRSMEDELDQGHSEDWEECFRSDGANLAQQWLDERAQEGANAQLVMRADDLMEVDTAETDYLLGLLGEGHVEYDSERVEGRDPTLEQMVEVALQILTKAEDGFFLMVEGARIDHAHHDTWAKQALSETIALNLAVEKAMEILTEQGLMEDTLFVVTSDHAHTMSFAGYPDRGTSIVGLNGEEYDDELPYTTLSYANGKGFENFYAPDGSGGATRVDLSRQFTPAEIEEYRFEYPAAAPRDSETHGGDDVAIFAQGPRARLFHSSHEQPYISNVMAFAACVGNYLDSSGTSALCTKRADMTSLEMGLSDSESDGSSRSVTSSLALLVSLPLLHLLGRRS